MSKMTSMETTSSSALIDYCPRQFSGSPLNKIRANPWGGRTRLQIIACVCCRYPDWHTYKLYEKFCENCDSPFSAPKLKLCRECYYTDLSRIVRTPEGGLSVALPDDALAYEGWAELATIAREKGVQSLERLSTQRKMLVPTCEPR